MVDGQPGPERTWAVADDGLARRLKALACTAPLHDMDARKSRLDWLEAAPYQMAEIALQIIDQVTVAMDFDHGASHDDVVRRVKTFVAAQAPQRHGEEHERVARWVLDNLINVGSVDRGFRSVYGAFDTNGEYRRLRFDFKLLIELAAGDGSVYLRASDEAINVLVGALDTDIESSQIAAEVKLENLIRRGRLSYAQVAAEQARYRTVQYAEILRRKLDATRRDVCSVDWTNEVPNLIEEALNHIEFRFRAEESIRTNITRVRDEADDPVRKRKAADLVAIVSDCLRRHSQLQARLQQAGTIFRGEQDRQQFSGQVQRASIDLFGQLLEPTLSLPMTEAERVTRVFFRAGAGLTVPGAVRLLNLIHLLLAPAAERDDLAGEVPEPDLAPAEDLDVFTEEQWQEANQLLRLDGTPRRLSDLLSEARELDPQLPHLIALRVLHAIDPEVTAALRQGDQEVLIAVDDGEALQDPEFGGSDLLVGVAQLEHAAYATGRLASPGIEPDAAHDQQASVA